MSILTNEQQITGATITLLAKSASNVAASSQTPALQVGNFRTLQLFLDAANVAGTAPTLDVKIETSPNGTDWYAIAQFSQVTTVASKQILNLGKFSPNNGFGLQGFGNQIRANFTVGGTGGPAFTVGITAIGKD